MNNDLDTINSIAKYTISNYIYTLNQEEKDIINLYSDNLYKEINECLRNDKPKTKEIKILDIALDKFVFDKKFKIYRKIYLPDYSKLAFIKLCDRGYIYDKAYQSTSILQTAYNIVHNVRMEIEVNNPNCGAYISPLSEYDESEFLLKRDTRIDIEDISQKEGICLIKGIIK